MNSLERFTVDLCADANASVDQEPCCREIHAIDELEWTPAFALVVVGPVVDEMHLVFLRVLVEQDKFEIYATLVPFREKVDTGMLFWAFEVHTEVPHQPSSRKFSGIHWTTFRFEMSDDPNEPLIVSLENVQLLLQRGVLVNEPCCNVAEKHEMRCGSSGEMLLKRFARNNSFTAVRSKGTFDGCMLATLNVSFQI